MSFLKRFKLLFVIGGIALFLVGVAVSLYFWVIPQLVVSHKLHNFIDKELYKNFGINSVIKNVQLDTSHFPYVIFKAEDFELVKSDKPILILNNIDSKISLSHLRFKKIIVNRLGADYIFADVNELLKLVPEQKEEQKPSGWYVDILKSYLYVKRLKVLYTSNCVSFDVNAKDIVLDSSQKGRKYLHFNFDAIVRQGKYFVKVKMNDDNKFYIENDELHIDDSALMLNKSKLNLSGCAKNDKKFNFDVSAKSFDISNVVSIVNSNIIISNGSVLLSVFNDIKGSFDFRFNLNPKGVLGNVSLRNLYFLFIPVENVPVHIRNGFIAIGKKDIELKGFSGYYGTKTVNSLKFGGKIKDYLKTFRMDIVADAVVTDDFAKYYLSEAIGVPIGIVGKADTKLFVKSKNNIFDLKWLFRVTPDCNLLVGGAPISRFKEKRVIVADMQVKDTFLKIKDLSYFVTVPGVAEWTKRKLISIHGLIDFAKGVDFRIMGFEIESPVPSEFLNIIARHQIFKGGTAVGRLTAVDGPKGVKLFGNLKVDKITVPSQNLDVDSAELVTNFDEMNIKASGKYSDSTYNVTGTVVNNIAFPMVVKNIDFSLDNMDFQKILNSFNLQGGETAQLPENSNVEMPTFDMSNLIIKKCVFRLGRGTYGDLDVKNLVADLSLDENSDLELDSNRFEFADGHSSCHVCCDLKKHKYHVKLGVKDVNSDKIATALLNLPKEISGKASGIINLETDDSFRLNGYIKFLVQKGTIGKIGLIQYVLNVASVFRNPIAMINPVIVFDLINIPDGEFDKIQGTLDIKNNLVENIKIKSFAPYLSAYIAGDYNLEKQDASLRIYTKMTSNTKGIYGFLRNISLSNLASRVSLGARNDVNYYSSEISELPPLDADEKDCQIFMTTVDGDIEHFNILSSLKKLR